MNHHIPYRLLVLVFLLVALAFQVSAQEATIVGSVTDPTGAVVPNATINITNTTTGQTWNVTSNEAGQYILSDVRVGDYTVQTTVSGFKAWASKGIVLQVGDRVRVDIKLEVGSASESVTVESEVLRVQADSAEVSSVVTGSQMLNLAMNGRNMVTLATLTPGVSGQLSSFQMPTSVGSQWQLSFNGQVPDHNVWLADGGETYDRGSGGKSSIMPSMEAIGEFRTLTSNYSAEYGLGSGGTISMVFKSGTRDLHGELWEFVRNDAFDANNYFNNLAGQPKPVLRFNTYGFNLGGPVVIGKYNKDRNKTFFFYNMEWRKIRQGQSLNAVDPSVAERGGDFSGAGFNIYVPAANMLSAAQIARFAQFGLSPGQQFPGNKIPAGLISPTATAFLATGALPTPNYVDASGVSRFVGGGTLPTNVREELVRIDHRFSDKFSIFGHFVDESVSQAYGTSMWSGDSYPTVGSTFGNPSYSAVARAAYTISPTLLSETSFNYNGNRISITPTGIYQIPSSLNLSGLFPSSVNTGNRLPNMNFGGELGTNYQVNWQPWTNRADDYQWRQDFSWAHGRHDMKFGGQFMLYYKTQESFGLTNGAFSFTGQYTGINGQYTAGSGSAFADFLLGYAQNFNQASLQDSGIWHNQSYSVYYQDNWRVNDRLTLNLGLRWEGLPHTYEINNRMSNFYPNLYNPANAPTYLSDGTLNPNGPGFKVINGVPYYLNGIGISGQNGIPNGLVQNTWNNWAPRIGFAWDVTGKGKTVIRGGFARMYERVQGNDMYNMMSDPPFAYAPTVSNVLLSNANTSVLTGLTASSPISPGNLTVLSYGNYKSPVSNQWSLGIQHELFPRSVLSVSYVGNVNNHQSVAQDINAPLLTDPRRAQVVAGTLDVNLIRPYPGWGSILTYQNAANSSYHSLQTNFRIEAAKGLTLQMAYTFSKSISETSAVTENGVSIGGTNMGQLDLQTANNPYNFRWDKGPSAYDRTHVAVFNYIYELPFLKNSTNKALKTGLGGWQISGITTFESGLALTPLYDCTSLGLGPCTPDNVANRPNIVGNITYPKTQQQWFNPAAFAAPSALQFGGVGKGILRGPGMNNWNLSLFKDFKGIPFPFNKEGADVQFRLETFNTFNHTQFDQLSLFQNAAGFGSATSTFDPRVLQLGLKFKF